MRKAPNGEGSVYYENNTDRYVFSYTDQDALYPRYRAAGVGSVRASLVRCISGGHSREPDHLYTEQEARL